MLISFEDYYRQATGQSPFAWQSRLAHEVNAGSWPSYVALPTAAGKTSLVEIWAYGLAQAIAREVRPRPVPLRLIWVVDRRIVVDAVAERARHLANLLRVSAAQSDHPLYELATLLSRLGGSVPLVVSQLRGGIAGQRQWVTAPNQPVVLATTVDQAGSRLLFRGYGVSSYQFSLEAGLIACDTLMVIDEAHLSQPFVATVAKVGNLHKLAAQEVAPGVRISVLSATLPSGPETERFTLMPEERRELATRLAHPKMAELIPAEDTTSCADALATQARRLIELTAGGVTAVIVNRVDTAREVFSKLMRDYDSVLLTGRIRPYDRDILLAKWLPRLHAGRSRECTPLPRVVVATQTVEVGADFDFDTLVTEVAPFSSLRQRFGRLNRLGIHSHAAAAIVQREKEDGVYPYELVKQVWKWLTIHACAQQSGEAPVIDLSDEAIVRLLTNGEMPPDIASTDAPILTWALLEQWSQTSPIPDLDPNIVPFLHGKEQSSVPEVQFVWRADLVEQDLICALDQEELRARIEQRLSTQLDLAPPRIEEALPLPIWAVRLWLTYTSDADGIADVKTVASSHIDRRNVSRFCAFCASVGWARCSVHLAVGD